MANIKKLVTAIQSSKSDVRYADLKKILMHSGYVKSRQSGSHVHFRNPSAPSISFPVHNNMVRRVYAKEIIKLLDL